MRLELFSLVILETVIIVYSSDSENVSKNTYFVVRLFTEKKKLKQLE